MSDYIERQAVIDAIHCDITITGRQNAELVASTIGAFVDRVKALPSADVVQVRRGKWKKIGVWGRVYRCNQCGNFLDFDGVNAGRGSANFCPNCGAKMDGGENG